MKVIIDGQAWLYAQMLLPPNASETEHEALQAEWKQTTAELVAAAISEGSNE